MSAFDDKICLITGAGSGIGDAALFLASDAASFINGAVVPVDIRTAKSATACRKPQRERL
ncbi:hypothetical protein [Nonomuraea jabiensis]|uniref:hypothetical protein n=1 Tax=Nonomuraea jabiensis TaxID=882448 RepID=UPI0036A454ED